MLLQCYNNNVQSLINDINIKNILCCISNNKIKYNMADLYLKSKIN